MKSKVKRVLAFFMMLCMVITMLPIMEAQAAESQWLWPAKDCYIVSSNFGNRDLNGNGVYEESEQHRGIDIIGASATFGQPVMAAKSGTIYSYSNAYGDNEKVWTNDMTSFGNYVIIKHDDGTYTIYAHMRQSGIKTSGSVKQGDIIGYIGNSGASSGSHLHFQIFTNPSNLGSSSMNPMPTNSNITIRNPYSLPNNWASQKQTYIFAPVDAFMKVENLAVPSSMGKGNSPFLSGNVTSNCTINWLWVGIRYKDTYTTLSSAETNPLSYTYDLKELLSKLDFAGLENGNYTLSVEATGGGQYWNLYSAGFTVKDAFMEVKDLEMPSSIECGYTPNLRGNARSNCIITWIWVGIRYKDTYTTLSSAEINPLSYTCDLKDLLSKLDFAGLENGNYTLSVEATGGGQYWNIYSSDFVVQDGTTSIRGDVNGDGQITNADLVMLARIIVGLE